MGHITFANPGYFWLFLLFIPAIAWYYYKQRTGIASIRISSFSGFRNIGKSYKYYLRHIPFGIRLAVLAFLIIVLARPQATNKQRNVSTEGIDIVLSVDLSGSMLAEDLKPNRMQAAIDVATEFIGGRPNDKIGLVVFAGESFTQCPLTTDHAVLINLFRDITGLQLDNGTAIGMGLATAVARIKDSKAKSKVVILLTDGENNAGEIDPVTAANLAAQFGIRVYTIGVGTIGMAPFPVMTAFGKQYTQQEVRIDEPLLKNIAGETGGKYFRATDNAKLKDIYAEIDKLEKTKIEIQEYSKKDEQYLRFGIFALLLLIGEIVVRYYVLRVLP